MKKFIAILLVVSALASMATVAFAANTTTLTTTVPAATYTLNIPANQEIPYGALYTDIGSITVTDGNGFASGKNLEVTASWDDFSSEGVSTTIPFALVAVNSNASKTTLDSGAVFTFEGGLGNGVYECPRSYDGTNLIESLQVKVNSTDWGKALAGEYATTITFTAEVVVEQ